MYHLKNNCNLIKIRFLFLTILLSFFLMSCNTESSGSAMPSVEATSTATSTQKKNELPSATESEMNSTESNSTEKTVKYNKNKSPAEFQKTENKEVNVTDSSFSHSDIPKMENHIYEPVNDNTPYFTDEEIATAIESFESYSELDRYGRCGVCVASIGQDIMPTEERGKIGEVRPTGWKQNKYAGLVDGNYLYNRCHLIGYQLTGENANTKNLITGTRYFNTEGMEPFENMVADYVKETNNHVLYRVTPIFNGDNLLADGVLMEASSVEDKGAGILFCVFVYNVQPGIKIDYATGDNMLASNAMTEEESIEEDKLIENESEDELTVNSPEPQPEPVEATAETAGFAVNQRNGKIHINGACSATGNGDGAMKRPVYFNSYEEAEAYSIQIAPDQKKRKCGNCW